MRKEENIETKNRNRYGMLCGLIGIVLNLSLFAGKLFAGTISGAISITADAFNNLSDAGSSVITIAGFKLAEQRPDEEHPYGHARIEYVATLAVSAIILIMGFELFRDSIGKLMKPEAIEYSPVIIGILLASIAVKCIMALYNFYFARKIKSSTLTAAGKDSLSDCIATSVVLMTTMLDHTRGWHWDGVGGIFVAAFIFYSGVSAAKDAIDPLLGEKPEPEFVEKLKKAATTYNDNILAIHDLMVHDYGPGHRIVSFHAEVPENGNLIQLHDIIDNLERKIHKELGCIVTIHMDPVASDDEATLMLKKEVTDIIKDIDSDYSIHDFRIVRGDTHTNLIFDAAVPFNCKMSDEEIAGMIRHEIKDKLGLNYYAVLEIDRENYIKI